MISASQWMKEKSFSFQFMLPSYRQSSLITFMDLLQESAAQTRSFQQIRRMNEEEGRLGSFLT